MRGLAIALVGLVAVLVASPGRAAAAPTGDLTCAAWLRLSGPERHLYVLGFSEGFGAGVGYTASALGADLNTAMTLADDQAPPGRISWLANELTLVCREARHPARIVVPDTAYREAVRRLREMTRER